MVEHLVAALSSVSDAAVADATVHNNASPEEALTPHRVEQSLLVRIGKSLSLPRFISPTQASRQQAIFDGISPTTSSTSTISPSRPASSRIMSSITASFATMMSPQRRRSSGDTSTTVSNSTAIVTSPRRGFDSKRQRNNAPQAITDFAGWGVCTIRTLEVLLYHLMIALTRKN